ncbi:MAG: MerR family transcriptional regulator [Armatimonadota bacterium]
MNYLMNTTSMVSMFGVHPSTLKRLERKGILQPLRGIANARLYSKEDVRRLYEYLQPKPVEKAKNQRIEVEK